MADLLKQPDISYVVLDPQDIERIIGSNVIDTTIRAEALFEYEGSSFYIGRNKDHSCIFWFPMESGIGNRNVRNQQYIRLINTGDTIEDLMMIINEGFANTLWLNTRYEDMEDVMALNEAGSCTPMPGYAFIVVSVH